MASVSAWTAPRSSQPNETARPDDPAASSEERVSPNPPEETTADPAAPSPEAQHPGTLSIRRHDLNQVLSAGFGRFLQHVQTEPHLERGRFVGFRLLSLDLPPSGAGEPELRPGDTIVLANGRSLERPDQALAVWNELRAAPELRIEFLRDGRLRELRFAIE